MRQFLPINSCRTFIATCYRFLPLLFLFYLGACATVPNLPEKKLPDAGATGVRGVVLQQDGSVATGAFVYAYRTARHGLRGPADFGVRVERSGEYFLDLVEGEYHLVARLRQSGADAGPPRPGDAWAIHPHNPVMVEEGKTALIDFTLQSGSVPRQVRKGSLTTGDTGFSGQLVDPDGRPFAGAIVLAYRTADFHRMPDLTSTPADEDGRFTLFVPESGSYCLAARTQTRGQPRAGEPYGVLDDNCRTAVSGELLDVGTIILSPYR